MNLPDKFIRNIREQLGDEAQQLIDALNAEPLTSIRLNEDKLQDIDLDEMLAGASVVPWSMDGYYLANRPQFTLDPLFHAGCYYVQEASSMFLQQALEQFVNPQSVVLDMCAAPGGKSTLISEYLGQDGLLVSNEVVRQRVFILSENIQKWGNGNTIVTHNSAADFGNKLPNLFDAILVDAPCSGEGMFRKDEEARTQWSDKLVEQCANRQRQIVEDLWDSLKPGGILIYSTCTFNKHENEEIALWISEQLGATILPIDIDKSWGIVDAGIGYHFYPHRTQGEGLYMCVLQKDEQHFSPFKIRQEKTKNQQQIMGRSELNTWLKHPEHWAMHLEDRFINAYPAKYAELIELLSHKLICISIGIGLAEIKGTRLAPQHSLAMAKDFNPAPFQHKDVDLQTALSFLRSEALTLQDMPIGIILITYKNIPLGFVKNIGNHSNNLYPNEWRIRKL